MDINAVIISDGFGSSRSPQKMFDDFAICIFTEYVNSMLFRVY